MTAKKHRERNKTEQQFTVRNFLKRSMICGLSLYMAVSVIATLGAFYALIRWQVNQTIMVSFFKNISIISSTLA